MIKKELNTNILAEFLILANTPFYLFKKFSSEESVNLIAQKYSTDVLIEEFLKYEKIKKKEIIHYITIYALVSSLSLKPYKEVYSFFKDLDKYKIKWFDYLKVIFFSNRIPEETHLIDKKYIIENNYSTNNIKYNDDNRIIKP